MGESDKEGGHKLVVDVELLEGEKVKVFFQDSANESDISSAVYDLGELGAYPVLTQQDYEHLLEKEKGLEILEIYDATLIFCGDDVYVLAG